MKALRLLLVEDDARARRWIVETLRAEQVEVETAADGLEGLRKARAGAYDAIVLDQMLPGCTGLEVCRSLRQVHQVPIIMVTALGELDDRVGGLDAGADDYMVKPIEPLELLARVRAVLRRAQGALATQTRLVAGDLVLHLDSGRATLGARELELGSYEFGLLRVFAEHAGQILSRDQLMRLAPGNIEDSFDRAIDVRVSRLRRKLGDDARRPLRLKTIRGVGYLLEPHPVERAGSDEGSCPS